MQNWRLMGVAAVAALAWGCGSSEPAADNGGSGAPPGGGGTAPPVEDVGTFLNVVPPGSVGNSAGGIGTPIGDETVIVYPDFFADQLELYGNLAYARENLQAEPCVPPVSLDEHEQFSDLACNYYKDAGLRPQTVTSSIELTTHRGGTVTIERDGWGVPFITADDREDAMYALGYASARDRLWLHDLLRNVGRGTLSEFLGPANDTLDFDADIAAFAGYSEDELDAMIENARSKFGALGDLIIRDVDAMVEGINDYVSSLVGANVQEIPPEYLSLAVQIGDLPKFPPRPWNRGDIVASATLIQSIFGIGGGGEHQNVQLLQAADGSFGPSSTSIPQEACELWRDLRHARDPDTPYTIQDAEFRTQSPPDVYEDCPQALPAGAAIFDPGSFTGRPALLAGDAGLADALEAIIGNVLDGVLGGSLGELPLLPLLPIIEDLPIFGAAAAEDVQIPLRRSAPSALAEQHQRGQRALQRYGGSADPIEGARLALGRAGLDLPRTMSNFIGVNADQTRDGAPIVVQGPQTSYFVPQLLWEVAIVSGGDEPTDLDFAGRGVVFGDLPYINIGRGIDFAFSATVGGSDLVDVRVSRLCNMDGTPPSREVDDDGFPQADGYLFDAGDGLQCRRMFRRLDEWVALPTIASVALGGPVVPQQVTRAVLRTHYGPVFATATVDGEPVAVSFQRATFFGELETAPPFALATTRTVRDFESFSRLFNSVTGSFSWAYIDADGQGVFHSGLYPQRHPEHPPELPAWGDGRFEWVGDEGVLTPGFFEVYGGDGNNGAVSFPNTAVPVPQGDPLDGYFEWDGYLAKADKPQIFNPPSGYLQNWNNHPAMGWWAADANGSYGPTHRSDMLDARLRAFQDSGRLHDLGTMIEIASDAAHVDLRGQTVLPLLLDLLQAGEMDEMQQQVVALMQEWIDAGSMQWISGEPGLGAYRRDRDASGVYDQRAQVVLMDAWYPELIRTMLPQLDTFGGPVLQGRFDAPRAQGSAFQSGWFQHMQRVAQMALDVPGHTPYRQLRCAESGTLQDCRQAVLTALDAALDTLGGLDNIDNWDGSQLNYPKGGCTLVEECDAVEHVPFSFTPVPPIHWTNRPTYQQAIQIRERAPR